MKILYVINPASGRTSNDPALETINAIMADNGFEFKYLFTTGDRDSKKINDEFADYRPDRVVACGGDGTVQLVARSLIGKKIPMGILPLGSANGMAKALEISDKLEEALSIVVLAEKSIPLDLIQINDRICIHLSDLGTNALLVKNYEEAGDKGMVGYAKHLIASIRESEPMHYTIATPNGIFEKDGYMLAIANAHRYGTGVHISDGSVSDGKFEICNVQEIDLQSAIKAGLTALNIFIDKDMFSDVISCSKAEIKINRKVHLQIDGEYIGETDTVHAMVMPAALRILVPS